MDGSFSSLDRTAILEQMAGEELDVLVIGGGITGAGIVWDASLRGMRAGLVEKGDFAGGTSSRSTKLVHGGLRYLKGGEFKLVAEVGRERALLHKHAPHVVVPAPMLMPLYEGGTYGYWASSIGLYIYDLLAGVKRGERRMMRRAQDTLRLEPLLKREGLRGSGYYYEYRTDDARLTMEVMKTARRHGAKIINYGEAASLLYGKGRVCGAEVTDLISGRRYAIYAKRVVNAAGPWADEVRRLDGRIQGKRLMLTKGVHLVVDHARLPVRQAAYFDVADGRMIFVIPRDGKTYIGTTDTFYKMSLGRPRTTVADRRYLLDAVNAVFPTAKLAPSDVESSWAGLRPLIGEEGRPPSAISRKDELFVSDRGLVTIAGGKLTGFRKMAEKVVNLIADGINSETGAVFGRCRTDKDFLSGGDPEGFASYALLLEELRRSGQRLGIAAAIVDGWIARYGGNARGIMGRFAALASGGSRFGVAAPKAEYEERALQAELAYSVEEEMTVHAADYLLLRTGLILFDRKKAESLAAPVVRLLGDKLGWSAEARQEELARVKTEIQAATEFPMHD